MGEGQNAKTTAENTKKLKQKLKTDSKKTQAGVWGGFWGWGGAKCKNNRRKHKNSKKKTKKTQNRLKNNSSRGLGRVLGVGEGQNAKTTAENTKQLKKTQNRLKKHSSRGLGGGGSKCKNNRRKLKKYSTILKNTKKQLKTDSNKHKSPAVFLLCFVSVSCCVVLFFLSLLLCFS